MSRGWGKEARFLTPFQGPNMTADQWQSAISLVGIPGAIIAAVAYAAWVWGWYLLKEVIRPVALKLVEFFDHLKDQVAKLVGSTDRMCEQMQIQNEKLDVHGQRLHDHGQAIDEIKTLLKK